MKVDFLTCDVFTDRPFAGNPLLVVPDARGLSTGQMQAIAREINYSESTFVLPPGDARFAYRQRTFVPFKEIPYAGHPTVGTAVVMAALGKVGATGEERITIEVGFGPLTLELIREKGAVKRVRMSQGRPVWEAPIADAKLRSRIAAALGLPEKALHEKLPPQVLSNMLWAAFGINRPDSGGRTAPSASNSQEMDIYVAMADGLFLYDAKAHTLKAILGEDLRGFTGRQAFVKEAPVNLIYVSDQSKMPRATPGDRDFYAAAHTGFISQNVYLFCASEGLATVVRPSVDRPALAKAMGLRPDQRITLVQTVGYLKK